MGSASFKNYFLGLLLVLLIAYGSYSFGREGYQLEFKGRTPQFTILNKVPKDSSVDFSLFWKAYDLLNQKYLLTPLDAKKLMYGAAQGLYNSVEDPYTMFLPPTENNDVNSSLAGKYEGIGAELGLKDGQLMVVAPLDGSPAQAAGIRPGDEILKIDDKDTTGLTLNDAVNRIRGQAGTKVTLTISHLVSQEVKQASKSASFTPPVEISLVRAPIKVESLKWEDKGDGVAYVRISRFGDTTDEEWDKAVSGIKSKIPNLKSVILDVRSNPGGYFQSAIHIASEFVPDGVISYQEFIHGLRQEYKVDHAGVFTKIPGLVLVNKGSASASEIVAGALSNRRSFKIVGEKSFGKGTVQDAENFEDGSGAHITIARWLTPNGYNIHGSGITPDVKVDISDEDITKGNDPQLVRALEIAKGL